MVSILEGVIQRGTGVRIRDLDRPLAGKTGTTNEDRDAWFIGFSPDLAVGVYVGYDQPKTLGPHETGASVAVPIWKQFMGEALAHAPKIPFRIPPGIRLVRIDADRGLLPGPVTTRVITEAFRAGTEPTREATGDVKPADVIDGSDVSISGVY
jgi:penicillin-binding protein 1A